MHKQALTLSAPDFSLADTLNCGQAFRWEPEGNGYQGIVGKRLLKVCQDKEKLILFGIEEEDLPFWESYFDLKGPYASCKTLYQSDPVLKFACEFSGGITILRQDPWEVLCSFIISQNNNIPRIKGIVKRLCETFGNPLENGNFSFPSPQRLSAETLDNLSVLRAGFRAKYILDAAQKVTEGSVDLKKIALLPYIEAKNSLMQIMGVGPKVADCALLYGFHRLEAFPTDVWIKRVMKCYYPNGLPEQFLKTAGVAQQYLFHAVRCGKLGEPKSETA